MATAVPDIEGRVIDVLLASRKHLYQPDHRGSWSIKRVIPAVLPAMSSAELEVGDSNAARLAWLDIAEPSTTVERRKTLQGTLRTYGE